MISLPVSRAALLHQRARVLWEIPSRGAMSLIAAVMDGASGWLSRSPTSCTARSLNSWGYLVGMVFIVPSGGVWVEGVG